MFTNIKQSKKARSSEWRCSDFVQEEDITFTILYEGVGVQKSAVNDSKIEKRSLKKKESERNKNEGESKGQRKGDKKISKL